MQINKSVFSLAAYVLLCAVAMAVASTIGYENASTSHPIDAAIDHAFLAFVALLKCGLILFPLSYFGCSRILADPRCTIVFQRVVLTSSWLCLVPGAIAGWLNAQYARPQFAVQFFFDPLVPTTLLCAVIATVLLVMCYAELQSRALKRRKQ